MELLQLQIKTKVIIRSNKKKIISLICTHITQNEIREYDNIALRYWYKIIFYVNHQKTLGLFKLNTIYKAKLLFTLQINTQQVRKYAEKI